MVSTTSKCSSQPEEHVVITPPINNIINDVTNGEANYDSDLQQEVPVIDTIG